MPHIQHALINHWLRDGKEVRSAAAGRIGRVVEVIDNGEWVKIQFGHSRSSYGVTVFNSGDDVYWREEHDVKSGKTSIIITNSDPTEILPPDAEPKVQVSFDRLGRLVPYDPMFHSEFYTVPISTLWEFQWHERRKIEIRMEIASLKPEKKS